MLSRKGRSLQAQRWWYFPRPARRAVGPRCMVCVRACVSMGLSSLLCGDVRGSGVKTRRRRRLSSRPGSAGGFGSRSDLVLPEGSCTELPRGSSLHPARGSSVQDASGWESAGSQEALWPPHAALTLLLPFNPPDPGSGPSSEPVPAFCSRQKAGPPRLPAARSADSGLPKPGHLAQRGWQIRLAMG